ncbi:MAG: hypothetical protein QXN56_06195 [Candidatus Hadarchaeum sp.]
MKAFKGFVFYLSLLVVMAAWTPEGSSATFGMWDVFPDNQGEFDVWCRVLVNPGGQVANMVDQGSYVFGAGGFGVPRLTRMGEPWILAQPLNVRLSGVSYEFTPILVRYFSSPVVVTEIEGEVKNTGNGQIRFVVSKAAGQSWINPVLNPGDSYVFRISPNEEVDRIAFSFFPQALPYSYNYRAEFWANVDYHPIPIPSTLLLLAPGLACIPILRRRIG